MRIKRKTDWELYEDTRHTVRHIRMYPPETYEHADTDTRAEYLGPNEGHHATAH